MTSSMKSTLSTETMARETDTVDSTACISSIIHLAHNMCLKVLDIFTTQNTMTVVHAAMLHMDVVFSNQTGCQELNLSVRSTSKVMQHSNGTKLDYKATSTMKPQILLLAKE